METKNTTAKKSGPRLFYQLQELSARWGRPIEELLCLALSGDLPVFLPYYGGAVSKIEKVMGYDPEQVPDSLHPEWAVSLSPADFSTVCQLGEVNVNHVFRYVEKGLETLSFSQPIKINKDLLVIPCGHVEAVEQAQVPEISETERESLLKIVALFGLAAAGESSVCYRNGSPNYSQMAKHISNRVRSHCPEDISSRVLWDGLSIETLRKKLCEGFGLLLTARSGPKI